jgi:hypothetical protein
MCTQRKRRIVRPAAASRRTGNARIEIVDQWHAGWPGVLKLIDRLGHREALRIDEDGWLSARQSVVVAFVDDEPTGHLCFHIHPVGSGRLEARLDAVGFSSAESSRLLSKALSDAAAGHARTLSCVRFKGLGRKPRARR